MYMSPIADQLSNDVVTITGSTYNSRFSMIEWCHGIKQMCYMTSTGLKRSYCFFIGSIGMSHRYPAFCRYPMNKLFCSAEFRCNINNPDHVSAQFLQSGKRFGIRLLQEFSVLRPLFLFGKERPFHMDADYSGSVSRTIIPVLCRRHKGCLEFFIGKCH